MSKAVSRDLFMACILAEALSGTCHAQKKQTEKTSIPSSDLTSGAELYKQHCAVCHGVDLRRTGSVPSRDSHSLFSGQSSEVKI